MMCTSRGSGAAQVWDPDRQKPEGPPGLGNRSGMARVRSAVFRETRPRSPVGIRRRPSQSRAIQCVAVMPPVWNSGRPIVLGLGSAKLTLWDGLTAKALKTLEGHTAGSHRRIVDPRRKNAASSSYDRPCGCGKSPTGKLLQTLNDHESAGAMRRLVARRQNPGLGRSRQQGVGCGKPRAKPSANSKGTPGP